MPARKKTEKPAEADGASFEDALGELESIVEAMEGEQLPLEDLVSHYEAGTALLKHCDKVLSKARKRIELITLSANGSIDPKSASSPTASDENPEDPDDKNDISLF